MATERNPRPAVCCRLTSGESQNVKIGTPAEFIVVPNSCIAHVMVIKAAMIPKNKYRQYTIGLVAFF